MFIEGKTYEQVATTCPKLFLKVLSVDSTFIIPENILSLIKNPLIVTKIREINTYRLNKKDLRKNEGYVSSDNLQSNMRITMKLASYTNYFGY